MHLIYSQPGPVNAIFLAVIRQALKFQIFSVEPEDAEWQTRNTLEVTQ